MANCDNPSTSAKVLGWDEYIGKTDTLVSKTLLGRYPVKVQNVLNDAIEAMEQVLIATGYENPCDYIGSYYDRNISGTNICSRHADGSAIDLDYGGDNPDSPDHPLVDNNPHIHRRIVPGDPGFGTEWQILEHQVRAIEAIKNVHGEQVWLWLGWSIGDTMHWQANVRPERCQVDWRTVVGAEEVCPWTNTTDKNAPYYTKYAPCEQHYNKPEWGPNSTGICAVPEGQYSNIDRMVSTGVIIPTDNHRDDYRANATYGTVWALLGRYDQHLKG